jgi:hypothetical protein
MQGIFGRFGKKNPPPEVASPNYRTDRARDRLEDVDLPEYPSVANYEDDDEETNWADAEALENENNPILRPQPVMPAVANPTAPTTPDPDDWNDALPAPTVKNSNRQEARRGKRSIPSVPVAREEEIWDDDLPKPTFTPPEPSVASPTTTAAPMERAVGLWTATIAQLRRILPARLRRLSDPLLTAIVIAVVTITIWAIDRLALPGFEPSVATAPSAPVATQPNPPTAEPLGTGTVTPPQISPEQAFVEAIQTQLAELTSQYPDNIVQNLQVDLATDRLIVRLAPVWYTLDDTRQNEIVDRMWNQARANSFSKLELQDTEGKSIARSPVVGREMIVLQRHQPA